MAITNNSSAPHEVGARMEKAGMENSGSNGKDGVLVAVEAPRNGIPDILRPLTDEELKKLERKLVKKLDWHLLLPLTVMYFMNFLDRTSITTAKVAGLQKDLRLRGTQYTAALTICYLGYLLSQIPSNILVAKFRKPAVYLSCCMATWGVISALTGMVHSFAALLVCRFSLGLVEAAFYPGVLYILSCWYTRAELAPRNSIFFAAQLLAGAFAGIITAAITKGMDGAQGLASWRWLFIMTGAATVFLALLALPFMPALPDTTKSLDERERALAKWRLESDAGDDGDAANKISLAGLKLAAKDVKVWVFSALAFGFTSFGSLSQVLPSIIKGLGFNAITTEYMVAPPYLIATVIALLNAYWAGRSNRRYIHIVVPAGVTLAAMVILASVTNTAVRYAAMCIMLSGNSAYSLVMTWLVNTLGRPASKRASALSVVSTLATINHLYNAFIFRDAYGPRYAMPTAIMAGFALGAIAAATVMRQMLVRENHRLDCGIAVFVEGVVKPVGADDTTATVTPADEEATTPEQESKGRQSVPDRAFRYII